MKFDSIEQRVLTAKTDETELEDLIREYIPFIRKKTTEVVSPGMYDSFSSVAMEAFAEAVEAFDSDKGSFLGFAAMVIKRRVKDQIRREYKPNEFPSENIEFITTVDESSGMAMEIELFKRELEEYGINIMELPGSTPKHRASREKANRAARVLAETVELIDSLVSTKKLPVTRLSERAEVPVKLIEKKRKYIVARALISRDRYGYLSKYID